jgi:hypothetical protein
MGSYEYTDKPEIKNQGNKLHRQRTINALGGMNLIEMLFINYLWKSHYSVILGYERVLMPC